MYHATTVSNLRMPWLYNAQRGRWPGDLSTRPAVLGGLGAVPLSRPRPRAALAGLGCMNGPPGTRCTPRPMSGLGASFTDALVGELLPIYRREIVKAQPWLRRKGAETGQAIMAQIKGVVSGPPPGAKPSGPAWLPDVIDPVLNPFVDGLKSEIVPVATKAAAAGVGGLVGFGFLLGWLLGRR